MQHASVFAHLAIIRFSHFFRSVLLQEKTIIVSVEGVHSKLVL